VITTKGRREGEGSERERDKERESKRERERESGRGENLKAYQFHIQKSQMVRDSVKVATPHSLRSLCLQQMVVVLKMIQSLNFSEEQVSSDGIDDPVR
jgi:hypothetical protein